MIVQFRTLALGDLFSLNNEVWKKTNFQRGYRLKEGKTIHIYVKKNKLVEPIKTLYGFENK